MSMEIIILAAGLGTRMKSDLPKVLHKVCEKPMLAHLLEVLGRGSQSLRPKIQIDRINIVVGYGRNLVVEMVKALQKEGKLQSPVVFTVQEQQLGTGHAVQLALAKPGSSDIVAIFNGDLPLFTEQAWQEFLQGHIKQKSLGSLSSTFLNEPDQYGRVLRNKGKFIGVVEYKDASASQKKIREINGGVYLFDRTLLTQAVKKLTHKNASGEFYLPDVFSLLRKQRKNIYAHVFEHAELLMGVNTMRELALAQKVLYARVTEKWLDQGVFIAEPEHTFIGTDVKISRGCSIGPFTTITGQSVLSEGVKIGAFCELEDIVVGEQSNIRNGTVAQKSTIGKHCTIGPMAHLRAGTRLSDYVRVGNFVEIKESSIGEHTNAAHLSYIGDAEIGSHVNLGCGFITCNYDATVRDGKRKHRTTIGNNVFVGSDCQVVAPIKIADGTYIASGSTITDAIVDTDSFAIARSHQVTKQGYAKKYHQKKSE